MNNFDIFQTDGHKIQACGASTGHTVKTVAMCESAEIAEYLLCQSERLVLIAKLDGDIKKLRVALRELVGACQRYDEEPSSLNLANYEAARDRADAALAGGKADA